MPLTEIQKFRGARAILDWTQDDLATRAGMSKTSISNFEKGNTDMTHNNKMACWRAFIDAGILFNGDSIKYAPPKTPDQLRDEDSRERYNYDKQQEEQTND